MNLEPHEPNVDQPSGEGTVANDGRRRGPLKFAYASGARPLDGYTIKRGIGAGGFGDVYYATSDAGKDVALKRIQRNLDVELRGVSQCLNLKHPNLVDLYDIRYDDQHQAWVVMEYVPGASLQDEIQRNPNGMPLEQMMLWLRGIIHGVAYLHDHGIVHRDLKPGNIFMDHQTVKIGDYGLSKFISCSRRSGQTESVGTFHYMAPEIGLGRYGKEIDIYALGILLFEMLTGRVPFEGESSQEIIMKHLTAEPNLGRVPRRYRRIISRAMAKDPTQRYASATEILDALEGNTSQTPGDVPPLRPAQTPPAMHAARAVGSAAHSAKRWARQEQEPIAAAVRSNLHDLRDRWRNLGGLPRLAIVVIGVFSIIANASWLFPTCFMTAIVYGIYYMIWHILFRVVQGPPVMPVVDTPPKLDEVNGEARGLFDTTAAPQAMAEYAQRSAGAAAPTAPPELPEPSRRRFRNKYRPKVASRKQINDEIRDRLQKKTLAQRGTELTGSMLMATVVATVLSMFMAMLDVRDPSLAAISAWSPLFIWLATTSVIASWSILFLGKMWEASDGDQALRRFCMLAVGMGVGCVSFLVYKGLMLDPVYVLGSWRGELSGSLAPEFMPALYSVEGDPHPLAFASYFGGLFLVLRWWLAADPVRTSRFGFWPTAVTIAISMLAYVVVPIPRGFMVAIVTIAAVQLSATWINPRRRRQIKERLTVA